MRAYLALTLTLVACKSAPEPARSAEEANPIEIRDFTLETLDGDTFTLSDHVGKKVVILSFWATWCAPCLKELPHLESIYQEEKDNGLLIVAVAMDAPRTIAQVGPTASRLGLTMPVALDTEQRAVRHYNRSRFAPTTVVFDRSGRVVKEQAGYQPGDEIALRREVRGWLGR